MDVRLGETTAVRATRPARFTVGGHPPQMAAYPCGKEGSLPLAPSTPQNLFLHSEEIAEAADRLDHRSGSKVAF